MEYYILALIILAALLFAWLVLSPRKSGAMFSSFSSQSIINKYSRDLTKSAREKTLDPVIGREGEIIKVIQILSRRNKNNPILIGRAGVGKTAIAEGLAQAIADKRVPPPLYNKSVLSLDLTGILAGTKYRGEFEERLKKITNEISARKRDIILFIDEIHMLSEAGQAEGSMNAADILKPMLAKGDLQVVGATTPEEYDKYIKNDLTLDRRLQPIFVSEPSSAETEKILRGVRTIYEKYHGVIIEDAAISAAVSATAKIKTRAYPDKAIDAIDEACSKVKMEAIVGQPSGKKNINVTAKDVKEIVTAWHRL